MYLLIIKTNKLFFNVNLSLMPTQNNADIVLIFFRLTVVQIPMAARSVHQKKHHFLDECFIQYVLFLGRILF